MCQATKSTTAAAAAAAAGDAGKLKKLKGRVMEDPISDEDDMFAEKAAPRRLTKENEEFLLLERNKKYVRLSEISVCIRQTYRYEMAYFVSSGT